MTQPQVHGKPLPVSLALFALLAVDYCNHGGTISSHGLGAVCQTLDVKPDTARRVFQDTLADLAELPGLFALHELDEICDGDGDRFRTVLARYPSTRKSQAFNLYHAILLYRLQRYLHPRARSVIEQERAKMACRACRTEYLRQLQVRESRQSEVLEANSARGRQLTS